MSNKMQPDKLTVEHPIRNADAFEEILTSYGVGYNVTEAMDGNIQVKRFSVVCDHVVAYNIGRTWSEYLSSHRR